jgi:hypothetical protein
MFRFYRYPKARPLEPPSPEPLKGRRKKARRAKHALSGFQGTDLYQNTDLASVLGNVTPSRRGQE